MPYDIITVKPTPVLKEISGWKTDVTKIREVNDIPAQLSDYIAFLEKELEVPIKYLSVGPDRTQTLTLN
jgi:adenylosuccinate synthase